LAEDFTDASVSRRNMPLGFENRVQAIACRIEKNGPMASLDLEMLEIERSER
jgi:hypothetical protein